MKNFVMKPRIYENGPGKLVNKKGKERMLFIFVKYLIHSGVIFIY